MFRRSLLREHITIVIFYISPEIKQIYIGEPAGVAVHLKTQCIGSHRLHSILILYQAFCISGQLLACSSDLLCILSFCLGLIVDSYWHASIRSLSS